ncbi:lactosylceramide 4-alpha-galactosyltransferase isoform X3 [Leptinotarsa decemlineata]|uniref:lactosylceramide 4-alpha-galactosyltransferase isoform X2 n=1 Tax=Leptinotarsa decemlineata TaxID=7539 RepID=UPI000C253A8F|nr:lactosylceramide 4-alpha-galactosyltransferase-like isoform X2 [Leptinotarsa decemlineata]XP_023016807.1 lactosylceramide 4-alpha-galactosyltransferase-like isoform X3 [Leptinotarsa decemlineata]
MKYHEHHAKLLLEREPNMNSFWLQKRKCLYILICSNILIWLVLGLMFYSPSIHYIPMKMYRYFYPVDSIYCYRLKMESLSDISSINPKKDKSIFFHETSCKSFIKGKISIEARQACAVESAAKMNPNFDVYLLFTSPGILHFDGDESDRFLKALLSYKNVKMMHLDYEKYVEGTPVEHLYKSGIIEDSDYAMSHASDVLRYLTLWKYGGIYLDLDVIVTKSLEKLPPNYSGAESDKDVAAGVMSFSSSGKGHTLAGTCLDDLKNNFNGRDWGYNGPGVVTRLLKSICGGAKLAKDMIKKDCQGFKVYPRESFYAVPWTKWKMFFDENSTGAVNKLTKKSYAIHVWNKHSASTKISLTSNVSYILNARKFCPKVVQECDDFF